MLFNDIYHNLNFKKKMQTIVYNVHLNMFKSWFWDQLRLQTWIQSYISYVCIYCWIFVRLFITLQDKESDLNGVLIGKCGGTQENPRGIWDLETQECFRLESVYLMIQQVWSSLGDTTWAKNVFLFTLHHTVFNED